MRKLYGIYLQYFFSMLQWKQIPLGGSTVEILKDRYTITELSEYLKITDHTLRYYEKEFNIKIPKDSRGRRVYSAGLANIMYQIKSMREQGLEIKAIKKIMESQDFPEELPPSHVQPEENVLMNIEPQNSPQDLQLFFEGFKEQLISSISTEVGSAKEHLSKEIQKSKLELGACMENGMRRLEFKMEKHFAEVDNALSQWRQKNKRSFFKRLWRG